MVLAALVLVVPTAAIPVHVDPDQVVATISPWIYGINTWPSMPADDPRFTILRCGGNRFSAYNWENNASNAGSDWFFQNDGWLESSDEPARAVTKFLDGAFARRGGGMVQLSLLDYVAADKNGDGDVRNTPNYLDVRFRRNRFTVQGGKPIRGDADVYQAQFAAYLAARYTSPRRNGQPLWFGLDNEPGLWSHTHAAIHPLKTTYAEMIERSAPLAASVKAMVPDAKIVGPCGFSWWESLNLAGAPDHGGRRFVDFYLQELKQASANAGVRLLDVLDFHFYSEHQDANGRRVTGRDTDEVAASARVQASRSLWDGTYVENSWITRDILGNQPIDYIGDLQGRINALWPGTGLGVTEWNFGGGHHISGAIAAADALGAFGRFGLAGAMLWELDAGNEPMNRAAFSVYRNYDGRGSRFGDRALAVEWPVADRDMLAVYASRHSDDPGRVTLVAINRSPQPLGVSFSGLTWPKGGAPTFVLQGSAAEVVPGPTVGSSFDLAPRSITVLRLGG